MSWIVVLIRRVIQALLPTRDKAPRKQETLRSDSGSPTIEVALYQSKNLEAARGRTPEQVLAQYLAQAIEQAGFDYKIRYGFSQTFDPPRSDNSVENFRWWANESPEYATHSNLLLYDSRGGGRAAVGGKNGIVGMNQVKRLTDETKAVCPSDQCGNMWAGIHELGHNLGGRHSTPMMQDKPTMLFHPNMVGLLREKYGN